MLEPALQPRGARRVLAAPDRLVFAAHERALASRAVRRHLPSIAAILTIGVHDTHDLRDDVARLLDDDAVAVTDVFAGNLVRVVQRCHRHRRAGDEHGLELGEWRDGPCATDVDAHADKRRFRLLRRKFIGDGPSRKFGRRPQPAAQRDVVELDHDTVGVERERACARRSFLAPLAAILGNLIDALQRLPMRLNWQPPLLERFQELVDASQACRPG